LIDDGSNDKHDTTTSNTEDDVEHTESILLSNSHDESWLEKQSQSSVGEMNLETVPNDSMDDNIGNQQSDDRHRLSESVHQDDNDNHDKNATATHPGENDDDHDNDMEIIHHPISTSNEHSTVTNDDIHPQGLPIDNKISSKISMTRKAINVPKRSVSLINRQTCAILMFVSYSN
jgi:hypothetical protein